MAGKQKEKTEMTRKELKTAALHLFLNKGYERTAMKDITDLAGYAVGTFYRHWKSKVQLLIELWDDFVSDFTQQSINNAPKHAGKLEMIQYLIYRSNLFSDHEITRKLLLTCQMLSTQSGHEEVWEWAQHYTEMLYYFLRESSGSQDEQALRSMASIMHTILNAHAIQNVGPNTISRFDEDTLSMCLLAMINSL